MRYRLLGNGGLRVSEAALGTMTFGDDWGWGATKDEAQGVRRLPGGQGNFVDTANLYTRMGRANRSSTVADAVNLNILDLNRASSRRSLS